MYSRRVFRPEGTLIVGKVHKEPHFFLCAKGEIIAWTESGMRKLQAGDILECQPGTKRVTLAVTDAIGITIHRTDKTDLDDDKNKISLGIDVLIGTPDRLNLMFSGAGFNVNTLTVFMIDDLDVLLRSRCEAIILRLSDSIPKAQRVGFCTKITEKVEILADRIMIEPTFFEWEE
jgi:superfamily II DNA/RNA helicase